MTDIDADLVQKEIDRLKHTRDVARGSQRRDSLRGLAPAARLHQEELDERIRDLETRREH